MSTNASTWRGRKKENIGLREKVYCIFYYVSLYRKTDYIKMLTLACASSRAFLRACCLISTSFFRKCSTTKTTIVIRMHCFHCHLNMLTYVQHSRKNPPTVPFFNHLKEITSPHVPQNRSQIMSPFLQLIWKSLGTSASVAPLPLKSLISWRYSPPNRNSMMSRISLG